MAWIESHQSLRTHRKVMEMAAEINKSPFTIIGLLHCFWWWAIDNAPLGDLSLLSPNIIEHGIGWREFYKMDAIPYSAGRFVAALVKVKFIDQGTLSPEDCQAHSDRPLGDGATIHDWMDFCGDLMKKRIERQSESRKRRLGEKSSPMAGRKVPPTVPYQTEPNRTLPSLNKEPLIPDDLLENKTEIMEWLAYKKEKGQTYKPKGLNALWKRFREIPKDQRREAVDHSMANGWAGLFEKKGNQNGQQRTDAVGRRQIGESERADSKFAAVVKTMRVGGPEEK